MAKQRLTKADKRRTDLIVLECANCGIMFEETPYGQICNTIMRCKPTCSFACNKELGQVK